MGDSTGSAHLLLDAHGPQGGANPHGLAAWHIFHCNDQDYATHLPRSDSPSPQCINPANRLIRSGLRLFITSRNLDKVPHQGRVAAILQELVDGGLQLLVEFFQAQAIFHDVRRRRNAHIP